MERLDWPPRVPIASDLGSTMAHTLEQGLDVSEDKVVQQHMDEFLTPLEEVWMFQMSVALDLVVGILHLWIVGMRHVKLVV